MVWPFLAVLAVTGNEVVDQVAWDERHVAGDDVLVAISVVAIAFLGSFFMKTHVDRHSWRT